MNGKKAKLLRKVAMGVLKGRNEHPGDGHNEYNQAMNCRSIVYDYDHLDPETGGPMITVKRTPGTITLAWKFRIAYKFVKRLYKAGELHV